MQFGADCHVLRFSKWLFWNADFRFFFSCILIKWWKRSLLWKKLIKTPKNDVLIAHRNGLPSRKGDGRKDLSYARLAFDDCRWRKIETAATCRSATPRLRHCGTRNRLLWDLRRDIVNGFEEVLFLFPFFFIIVGDFLADFEKFPEMCENINFWEHELIG